MLPFKIAYRFLKNRKGQTFLIASAVAIGISIQIFLGLLIQNLQSGLIETTIGETSHITLKSKDTSVIKNGSEINNLLMKSDSKIVTSLEVLDRPGLILNKNTSTSVLIRSFDLEQGDKIYILTPSNEKIEFTVSGILDLKVKALNKNYVVTNIDTLRDVYKLPNDSITSIETQLSNKDIFEAENVAQSIKDSVGSDFLVDNWINENESLLSGLKGQSASSYTIQVFIVISVLVAIASILAITVLQKTKQIGILKAMGITDKKASLVFIIQGGLLGILGGILGSSFGVAMFKIFQTLVKNSNESPLISGGVNITFVILSALIAIIACIISSIVPAVKCLKLDPVDAIKL